MFILVAYYSVLVFTSIYRFTSLEIECSKLTIKYRNFNPLNVITIQHSIKFEVEPKEINVCISVNFSVKMKRITQIYTDFNLVGKCVYTINNFCEDYYFTAVLIFLISNLQD